jgi:hypothetical protein
MEEHQRSSSSAKPFSKINGKVVIISEGESAPGNSLLLRIYSCTEDTPG